MGYSSVEDLKKLIDERQLIALTDDEGSGSIDEVKINEFIDIADREIDAYCSGKYDVPFANPPEIIKNISAQMAIYYLLSRRLNDYPEVWRDKYKNSIKLLEKIQDGKISIQASVEPKDRMVRYTQKTRYWTLESMKNY